MRDMTKSVRERPEEEVSSSFILSDTDDDVSSGGEGRSRDANRKGKRKREEGPLGDSSANKGACHQG